MAYRKTYSDMYIPRDLIHSKAFWQLSATAIKVYLIFLGKRRFKPFEGSKSKRSGKGKYYIANNGKIQFTYKEAQEKYSVSAKCFTRAIDQLVQFGFIDISSSGSGLHRDVTLYAISARWQKYGCEEFVPMSRPKRKACYGRAKYGFKKGNRHATRARTIKLRTG
jgi:hypothetical protein